MRDSEGALDHAAVGERRRQMFPQDAIAEARQWSARGNGSTSRHCDICPLGVHDNCNLSCDGERAKRTAEDGVKVS